MIRQILINFFILSSVASARVFSMKDAKFAGYLNAAYGTSVIEKTYFEDESSSTDFSKGFSTLTGGEFGFISTSGFLSWIFGFEMIKPTKISGGVASTGGAQDYLYTSDITAYAPKVGVEVSLYQTQNTRVFINGTVGTASVQTKTKYSTVTIAPNADFVVEGKGSANLMSGSFGFETHWTDNTTFVMLAGYRDLKFRKLKYVYDVTDFQGAHVSGATILKTDGSKRQIDLTGTFAILGLRFWLF